MTIDNLVGAGVVSPSIRKALDNDVEGIANLIRTYGFSNEDPAKRKLIDITPSEILSRIQNGDFYVAALEDKVVGCSSVIEYGGVIELRSLATAPQYHNNGIGGHLIEACITEASGRKMDDGRAYLQLFTLTQEPSVPLFEKFGFTSPTLVHQQGITLEAKYQRDCVSCPLAKGNCVEIPLFLPLAYGPSK